jgi:NhaP-type Na+/H+ or K+/H+ antiporter
VALHFTLAAPGRVILGIVAAPVSRPLSAFVSGTLGGNLLQFVQTFLLWIIAEYLGLSAVLMIVTFAMTLASNTEARSLARMRVQSYAVWSAVVFVLNVLALMLMGMQVRTIAGEMALDHLGEALLILLVVVVIVIVTRLIICVGFNRVYAFAARRRGLPQAASIRQGGLSGWCGMRGLVTLATTFALPADFPQRDMVVLAAFSVVLATLVVQGLTLSPVIRLLGLDRRAQGAGELRTIRHQIVAAGLASVEGRGGPEAEIVRSKILI